MNWPDVFKSAIEQQRLNPGQKRAGVTVANFKPPHESARNLYKEDQKQIHEAAANLGFHQITEGKYISFIR